MKNTVWFISDPLQACPTPANVLYDGYCIGLIEDNEEKSCQRSFMPRSYALAIKSKEFQNFISSQRTLIDPSKGSSAFEIGLHSTDNNEFR